MASNGHDCRPISPRFWGAYWEFVEVPEGYCLDGYHPTHLGDIFHGRYKVIHKLGYGSFAVVWLARDLETNRNVALKILAADASQKSMEAQILRAVNAGDKNHPGYPFISQLLEDFWFDGPNGRHLCLVLRATGCSVADSQDDNDRFPINVARSISAQALLGLSYIHSCGVVHGDLHRGNILFQRSAIENWTEAELIDNYGEPVQLSSSERQDGKPQGREAPEHYVPLAMIGMSADRVPEDLRIIISDFGQSFLTTEVRHELQTPRKYAPPEHFFKGHLGPPADVWSLSIALYSILFSRWLFEGSSHPDSVLFEMYSTLGRLPDCWWDSWEGKHLYFDEDGPFLNMPPMPLAERLHNRGDRIGDDEQKSLEQLFKGRSSDQGEVFSDGMLEYEPSRRMTVDDALRSDWVTRWAWPDFKRLIASQRDLPLRDEGSSLPTCTTSYATYSENSLPQTVQSSYSARSGEPSPRKDTISCTVRSGESSPTNASTYKTEQINNHNEVTGCGGLVPDSVGSQNLPDTKDASLSDAARKEIPMASIAESDEDHDGSGGDEDVKVAALSDTAHNGSSTDSTADGIKSCDGSGDDSSPGGLLPNEVES